jgi:hypothetical protein
MPRVGSGGDQQPARREPVRITGMFHPAGSELRVAEAKRTKINGFGIAYQGKSALSAPSFSWAA